MFHLFSSSDFIIKLWDLQKKLIAEITLDNTLSTACFLNNSGDILLAFKNDLYLLSHNLILDLPKSKTAASEVPEAGNVQSYINISVFCNIRYIDSPILSILIRKKSYIQFIYFQMVNSIYCV